MNKNQITPTVAKIIRQAYGYNQTEFSQHIGSAYSTYTHWETNYSSNKTVQQKIIENVDKSVIQQAIAIALAVA